jgi:hypothetical protein
MVKIQRAGVLVKAARLTFTAKLFNSSQSLILALLDVVSIMA